MTPRRAGGGLDWDQRVLRSVLFAPGNHARKLEKVGTFGADLITLDLEDAVADAEKAEARTMVRAALPTYDERTIVSVRVNAADTGRLEDDLEAVVCDDLDCVLIPKVESTETLPWVDSLLNRLEKERGIEQGTIRVLTLVETALGIVLADEIALGSPERVLTLIFGLGDFSNEIGVDLTPDAAELLYARSRVVVAARAAQLRPALDGPYLDLKNYEGLRSDSLHSRQLGFEGRVVVYPPQVEHVHRAYSDLPSEEAEAARRIVEAFEEAEAEGSASIQVDGRFVDYPIYWREKRKLQRYEALQEEPAGQT